MLNNPNFYPTPKELIAKMTKDIDFTFVKSVLEPSAGKGDIAEFIIEKHKEAHSYRGRHYDGRNLDLDVIEIDPNLQLILKGKKFKVVQDDFLSYSTQKQYDLIVMNPPFDKADEHLLKAIKMQEKGGQIVCLMNAETIKNPYSKVRKDLKRKLEELNADVEFLEDSFSKAERKTNVEVAMVKIDIPKPVRSSVFVEGLKQEEEYRYFDQDEEMGKDLVIDEFLKRIVEHYKFEVSAGVRFINEYHSMKPNFINTFKEDGYKKSILVLSVDGDNYAESNRDMINSYIKSVRYKYWETLFTSNQFNDLFTSALRTEYYNKINTLVDYDFSLYNIYSIQEEIRKALSKSVDDSLIEMFDEFSHKHSWYDETSKNIHLYNGWKTNKSWKINKKVIIPLRSYSTWDANRLEISSYDVINKLTDIEKVLNYLGQGLVNHNELRATLEDAQKKWNDARDSGISANIKAAEPKKIKLKYFMVSFFKKGTCHIEFTDSELLDRFNLYGSMKKGWLPPSYGKKDYNEMSKTEQKVVDEFQGEKEYKKVMENKELYLPEYATINLMGKGLPALEQLHQPEEGVVVEQAQEETSSVEVKLVEGVNEIEDIKEINIEPAKVINTVDLTIEEDINENTDIENQNLTVTVNNATVTSEEVETPIEKFEPASSLGENVTLITSVNETKDKTKSKPTKDVIIETSDVVIVSPPVEVKEQKDLDSIIDKTAPLLLTATYVEPETVIDKEKDVKNTTEINNENIAKETQLLTIAVSNTDISSEGTESSVGNYETVSSLGEDVTLITTNKKTNVKPKPVSEIVIEAEDVEVLSSQVNVEEQNTLNSNADKTASLLLTTTYVEVENVITDKKVIEENENITDEARVLTAVGDASISSEITESNMVVASSPVKDKEQKALKPNTDKDEPKEITAKKVTVEESKIEEDILPDFISLKEDVKEGENIQLGFAI